MIRYIDGSVQDCSNSSALAMELLQSCTKPSISCHYLQYVRSLSLSLYIYIYIYIYNFSVHVTDRSTSVCAGQQRKVMVWAILG